MFITESSPGKAADVDDSDLLPGQLIHPWEDFMLCGLIGIISSFSGKVGT